MRSIVGGLAAVLGALAIAAFSARSDVSAKAGNQESAPIVDASVQGDVSPPLHKIPPMQHEPKLHEHPSLKPEGAQPGWSDPVIQSSPGLAFSLTPGLNIPGVGNGDYGFKPDAAPPDPNGAVGDTQYVQWVNESFAVFDKKTGAKLYGPADGKTLWAGFGGGCEKNNDGDPIVQFDKLAHRWVFTQFSVSTTPFLQCVAVSDTNDATKTFHRWAFSYGNQFPDYPKLGVWPDAYYVTYNIFTNGATFAGPKVCAWDRAAMINGDATIKQVCFQLGSSVHSLLPSDLDSATQTPSPGTPNLLARINTGTALQLWQFSVDWTTTSNSTLTALPNITVAGFTRACNGDVCIPQPGTSTQLDSLADRAMYRFSYRNFGTYESWLLNHSVATSIGRKNKPVGSGIRWYELQRTSGSVFVKQQGTYAPDASYRWMGSIAQDAAGNILVGYSVSSGTVKPSIRIAGREPGDATGTLGTETSVVDGGGSQTGGLNRWGDYTAMSVDPVDDCTFYYTNEYLKANGSFNWSTWISSSKFPSCS